LRPDLARPCSSPGCHRDARAPPRRERGRADGDRSTICARTWLDRVRRRGATEMHVHRLAENEAERTAI
ncbi:hypothetical protein CTI14_72120, partial [Methylobacterium radiotolerans]